ncbi:MAG: peptidoglycan DD-metalloendopeptidase family protein [Dehalococcoidia bacterium]
MGSGRIGSLCIVLALAAAIFLPHSTAEASDNLHQYKFPCIPGDACYITQLNHGGAFDFDPQGSAGLGSIRAVSEGTFDGYFGSGGCTWPNPGDAGRFARVLDIHGRTMIYAHLSQFGSLQPGQRVLQGDPIGVEGNTGNSNNCAPHLHLGGIATAAGIDGKELDELTANPTLYFSTNSAVGDITVSGGAINNKYRSIGAGTSSWGGVGWTADRTGTPAWQPQPGCLGSFPYCRLYPHYFWDPVVGHWGKRQEFRLHPDGAGREYSSIMTGRWTAGALDNAYWVRRPFYDKFLDGGQFGSSGTYYRISIPLMDKIGNYPNLCDLADGCLEYQRFHLGYIWNHNGAIKAQFCPDVDPFYPNPNYAVTVADITQVVNQFGTTDPNPPFQQWANAWRDIDGDGAIAVNDISLVTSSFGFVCYPQ